MCVSVVSGYGNGPRVSLVQPQLPHSPRPILQRHDESTTRSRRSHRPFTLLSISQPWSCQEESHYLNDKGDELGLVQPLQGKALVGQRRAINTIISIISTFSEVMKAFNTSFSSTCNISQLASKH